MSREGHWVLRRLIKRNYVGIAQIPTPFLRNKSRSRSLARVELRGVAKSFPGGIDAIHPLDLTIGDGALFVIVGPSGSGKSTLLRLIAGLESLGAGSLWIGGSRADGLSPRDRDVAMVFQTPVVYPHLSVFENLAFGLRARG